MAIKHLPTYFFGVKIDKLIRHKQRGPKKAKSEGNLREEDQPA